MGAHRTGEDTAGKTISAADSVANQLLDASRAVCFIARRDEWQGDCKQLADAQSRIAGRIAWKVPSRH